MRDERNVEEVTALDIDLMGFIFYAKSPRFVEKFPITAAKAPARVGVFVNEPEDGILRKVLECGLDWVQLHGDETPGLCAELKKKLKDLKPEVRIIKAVGIGTPEDLYKCPAYDGYADMLLLDTRCDDYGGSGSSFDWNMLGRYCASTPFLLSGGIGPEDAGRITANLHPKCAGIDLNSRFETAPGVKDAGKINVFIDKFRKMTI